ncbi:hypothetical protein B1757_13085 [Acidithiobacillus marinus]|uniref:Uncharacterized protein n=1 Tax=Acidithiobacillus marinus TaxID=187490 RepID=A0A2I1DIX2_9PROT|nr:hypothetical protein [Acidithiobacillus marinus]PKY09816.1 hypothetical protein B1757_13085 [Acidithiobacillus marinus]
MTRGKDMVVILEIAGPFRWRLKAEHYGPLRRLIWGWFSVAYISAGFNDVAKAIRQDERERLAENSQLPRPKGLS